MKTKYIKMIEVNDIYNFVREASAVDGDVIVQKGKFSVDGRSLLGVFSIDLSSPVKVEYPEEAERFDTFVSKFEVGESKESCENCTNRFCPMNMY